MSGTVSVSELVAANAGPWGPDTLLEAVSRCGDAPEQIQLLRKLVVTLAVTGKLRGSGTRMGADQILSGIKSAVCKSVELGEVPKKWGSRRLEPAPERERREFSGGGRFEALGALARIEKGKTGIKQAKSGPYAMIVTAADPVPCDHFDFDGSAAIVPLVSSAGHGKAALNRLHYREGKFALGTILAAVFPYAPDLISARFIFEYLSTFKDELLVSRMIGTANVSLSLGEIAAVPIPLICPTIQARVDELMASCDRLEAARVAREATRDRLAAASLARLNSPDPETFQSDARFALDTLPSLTTRPDQIKQLRQTILNLAVRGRLVPQGANDEPASSVLEKIRETVGSGRNRRQSGASEARSADELPAPFDLPVGWAWASFPELGTFGRGKSRHRPRNDPKLFDGGVHPLIQTGDVARSSGVITTFGSQYNDLGLAQSLIWPKGTLCITIAANIADTGILGFDACFPDSVVGFVPAPVFESARYFEYFLRTAKSNLTEFAPATAQKNINLEILESVRVPLPPLAEQSRIVAKVDELMALCDRLEATLTNAADTRRRALEALLSQSLRVDDELAEIG